MFRKTKVRNFREERLESKSVLKGSKSHYSEKLIVFVAFMIAGGLCTAQLSDIMMRFFRRPIANYVKIIKSNTFKIPPFVICPVFNDIQVDWDNKGGDGGEDQDDDDDEVFLGELEAKIEAAYFRRFNASKCEEQSEKKNNCSSRYYNLPFCDLDVNLDDLWSESQIKVNLSSKACRVAVNRTKCKENESIIQVNVSKPTIFGGNCMIITHVDELYYNQRSKGLKFNFMIGKSSNLAIAFLDNLQSVAYDVSFEATPISSNSAITIFNFRMFNYLNTMNAPCVSNERAKACRDLAIEDALEKLNLCKLPMLNSTRHPTNCTTFNRTKLDAQKLVNWFLEQNMGKCYRQCQDGVVSFREVEQMDPNPSGSFSISLANNVVEVIGEEYAYGGSALLSDIAGNVGFYLGISMINIISKPLIFVKNRFF